MKIKIHSITDGYPEVEAKELKFKGRKGFRFFIHKRFKDIWNVWGITEFSSGLSAAAGQTQADCMKILKKRLKKYTIKQWKSIIKKDVKKHKSIYPLNK